MTAFSFLLASLGGVGLFGIRSPAGAQEACYTDQAACPTLVGPDGLWLEPSGLAWLPEQRVLVGVSDDVGGGRGYELFYIHAEDLGKDEIPVHPLLTPEQSLAVDVQDLEGLTAVEDTNTLYAIGSLSLDKFPERAADRWNRHHLIRVDVEQGEDGEVRARTVEWVAKDRRPDFREWVISSSGRPWAPVAFQGRPESGGLNVEGLASDARGNLLVGFRGPLDGGRALVLRVASGEADEQPRGLGWLTMDLSGLPGDPADPAVWQRGIRGLDRIPETEEYVGLVGHTGPRYDNLRIIRWNPVTAEVADLAELPESFVGEGIAVMEVTEDSLQVAVVSDKDAKIMVRRFPRSADSVPQPNPGS